MKFIYSIRSFAIIFLGIAWRLVNAQDAVLSMYYRAPLSLNPALTGFLPEKDSRLSLNYGSHFGNISAKNAYRVYQVSFDRKLCVQEDFFGLGFQVHSDFSGTHNFTRAYVLVSGSYHRPFTKNTYLSAGMASGLLQNKLNENSLKFDVQFDGQTYNPALSNQEHFTQHSSSNLDLWLGLTAYNVQKNWTLGVSVYHLNRPDISFINDKNYLLGVGFSIHGSAHLIPQKLVFREFFRRQSISHGYTGQWQNICGGMYKLFPFYAAGVRDENEFWAGSSVRLAGRTGRKSLLLDAWIPTMGFETSLWTFYLSYDVKLLTRSDLSPFTGYFELNMEYRFGSKNKCVLCPRM